MKRIVNINICLMLSFLVFLATGCETQYLGGDRNARWKKDLNYLQEALPNKHVNLFFKINEEQFSKDIDSLKNSVNNLNDDEIIDRIYKIVASVGDGHTKVMRNFAKMYPVQFYYFKDGVYVINASEQYKEALYCKLIKINGQDIKSVEDRLSPLIAQENEATIKKIFPTYLSRPEILHGAKIIDDVNKEVTLTFENKDGRVIDLNVMPLDNNENVDYVISGEYDDSYPLYMQNSTYNYWYKYLENDKVLYLKYNECMENNKSGRIEDFNNEILNFINNNQVDKFVIDMRDNSGGRENGLDTIIEGIKNKDVNNKDRFFVIVGRNTFSAAILDIVKWRNETNATFIGQPTSGKPNHYGSTDTFTLPNSKLSIQYSKAYAKTCDDESDSFIPDKKIEISIDDYVNKNDPIIDYIIKN